MNARSLARWLATIGAAALLVQGSASAAEVHVMISAGFYQVYAELGPAFERASGHRLVTTRGPSMGDSPEAIPTRLARGETADVVILDGAAADERKEHECQYKNTNKHASPTMHFGVPNSWHGQT